MVPGHLLALEMKGDICKHFYQQMQNNQYLDQAFYYYSKAIESNPTNQSTNMSSALSNMGDLYRGQGRLQQAILHYEESLRKKEQASVSDSRVSKIYAETFMKLFNTKMACCDWRDYFKFTQHLKEIVLKQYTNGEVPCVDPFSLFMIDFSMEDKLLISARWAESEKQKAYDQMKRSGINYF